MSDPKTENRLFWENEEKKLDERLQEAIWPGGDKAVEKLARKGKRPVRELIAELIDSVGEARVVDLAERFGVSHPTVNKVVGRLQREGLVTSRPYRSIFLTEDGQALAEEVRRRHRIVFDFLCSIGVSETTAAMDAEGIEHHVSEETLTAMERIIGSR